MVKQFTSHTEHVDDLKSMLAFLKHHADQGHCLLKGHVNRPLRNESRAGATNANESTEYIVLDLDFDEGFSSVDAFMDAIGLEGVSYIWHHSSSAGIKYHNGLRGHAFVLLDKPTPPHALKQWLRYLNLEVPELNARLELTASQMALRWPLDTTTCQNDKLIYIADPICIEFEDPKAGKRFELRERTVDKASIDTSLAIAALVDEKTRTRVNELRKELGLKARVPKYKEEKGLQLLTNPEKATVTGTKTERGFTYLNLNGGDSFAYFHPNDNFEIIHNFKGEPAMRTRDVAPDYYWALMRQKQPEDGASVVGFRDPRSDQYLAGYYDPATQSLDLNPIGSKPKLADFFLNHGELMPDPPPEYDFVYDPHLPFGLDKEKRTANKFKPSPMMVQKYAAGCDIPKTIARVLRHVLGDCDTTYQHFINWIAVIFQHRIKTGTAWVIGGTTGTGKGTLKDQILTPLLGLSNISNVLSSSMQEQFNSFVEDSLLVWIDEADLGGAQGRKVMAKMKNWITEPVVPIRRMRTNTYDAKTYCNFIACSNYDDMLSLEADDRRFNIAPMQAKKLKITPAEYQSIALELPLFAAYLHHYPADIEKARKPLESKHRRERLLASQTNTEIIASYLRDGDIEFFLQFKNPNLDGYDLLSADKYNRLVDYWVREANEGATTSLTTDDLITVFSHLADTKISRIKAGRLAQQHRIKQGKNKYEFCVRFQFRNDPGGTPGGSEAEYQSRLTDSLAD